MSCGCKDTSSTTESLLTPHCTCPRNELDIVIHEEECLLYKNERIIMPNAENCECDTSPPESGRCECCGCPPDQCRCNRAGREVLDQWRQSHGASGAMPAVLEATHPLMMRFQQTLKQFLEKENAIAEAEIQNLKDELRLGKEKYDMDLQNIYTNDHDTNAQRVMIEEYEANLSKSMAERQEAEQKAKDANVRYKKAKEKLEEDIITERETTEELEALTRLCSQLETWREETESDLAVSQRVSDKMRREKQILADEKRQLDMIIFGLNNEVWKLESKLEMFNKQIEIKNNEMEAVNDKVTAYAAELEDLELDKRRLVSLWNSVIVNIQQRDKVYDSVRDDYRDLQENYKTLLTNLEITKKMLYEEINKGKEIEIIKDKINYDLANVTKTFELEDAKRISLESQIAEASESIEMCERDQNMIQMENHTLTNILKSTEKEVDRKMTLKMKMESDILENLQECLLNDKAVESMANGIKKMRDMSRKQEISLMAMENQHAKVMLDIEVCRNNQAKNNILLEQNQNKVKEKEAEIDALEEKVQQNLLLMTRKQRELDNVNKKYAALKEIFDTKTPQERRAEELEQQIRGLRERAELLQQEWLRLQGHVVKLATHHQKLVQELNLINKQIQICDHKHMSIQADCEKVLAERSQVDRNLRDLRGKLQVLERTRKDASERNENAHKASLAITHEYAANLKDAETEIIQIEEEIEAFEKEKANLVQELDRITREALIWQRKGIQALELKKNIHNAKSAAGEIGQMKTEIHRMEVRREQLRRIGDKLSEDLAACVTRRDNVMEKSRAAAAVERAHGATTSQFAYHHRLRLARADLARVNKDIADAKARVEFLAGEEKRLEKEVSESSDLNAKLEESIATTLRRCVEAEREKQWLLERVVRSQRLSSELQIAIKRQSLKVRKSKPVLLKEYKQSRMCNDRIRHMVDTLAREYPFLDDKLAIVNNTLDIHTPGNSPRITEDAVCEEEEVEVEEVDVNVAEKPLAP